MSFQGSTYIFTAYLQPLFSRHEHHLDTIQHNVLAFIAVKLAALRRATFSSTPIVIDGNGHLIGRLASIISKQILSSQKIVVVRCEEINISGILICNKVRSISSAFRVLVADTVPPRSMCMLSNTTAISSARSRLDHKFNLLLVQHMHVIQHYGYFLCMESSRPQVRPSPRQH